MVVLGDQGGDPTAHDATGINAGLVKRHGLGTGFGAVIVADDRHRGWEVEGFAEADESANGDELPELGAPTRGHSDDAPEETAAEDEIFAFESVAYKAGERGPEGIDPHERGADESQLNLVESVNAAQFGKD